MKKLILQLHDENYNNFELNINDLDFLDNLNLSLDEVILKCKEALEKNDNKLFEKYFNLASKLDFSNNKEFTKLKNEQIYIKTIEIMSKKDISVQDYIEVLLNVRRLSRNIICEKDEEAKEYSRKFMVELRKIQQEIDINIIIKNDMENFDENKPITIKELQTIKAYINNNKSKITLDCEEVLNFYGKFLNKSIKKVFLNMGDTIKEISVILSGMYDEDFFKSSDFKDVLLECTANKVETYETLVELTNRAYLVYRFNRSIDLENKKLALTTIVIPKYIRLTKSDRDAVVEKIDFKYKNTLYNKKFFRVLDKTIDELVSQKSNKMIPL